MIKIEKFMIVTLKNIEIKQSEIRFLRGYFADLDYADEILHNHDRDGKSVYRYPMIQYKICNHHPAIVAYGEGIRSLHKHLMEMSEITLGKKTYKNVDMDIRLREKPIGDCPTEKEYEFQTVWLALNQENYQKYCKLSAQEERDELLSRVLIGNILALCKGFEVVIEKELHVSHHLREIPVTYKGEKMIGFTGHFLCNCSLPSLCGIGKGSARGFGTIKQIIRKKGEDVDGI